MKSKKSYKIGLEIILILLIIILVLILLVNKTNPLVNNLNEKCSNVYCTPYIDMCDQWRAEYDHDWRDCKPLIKEVIALNDLSACKQIKRKFLATYCISLITSEDSTREECLEYAENNRTLQAICHITKYQQYLFQNSTTENYYILDHSFSPSILIWQQDENNLI